jgi:pyruvate, water dikinase
MSTNLEPFEKIFKDLQERKKELQCIYRVEEVLNNPPENLDSIFDSILKILPDGYQFPKACRVRIAFEGKVYRSKKFKESACYHSSKIMVQDINLGSIKVFLVGKIESESPFLEEEQNMLDSIAQRMGTSILYLKHRKMIQDMESAQTAVKKKSQGDWRVILDLIRTTDQNLFIQISRKMMNYLTWSGNKDAAKLMQKLGSETRYSSRNHEESNVPSQRTNMENILGISDEIFTIAADYLSDKEILHSIHKWIQEDKASFLVKTIEDVSSSLTNIVDALMRYQKMEPQISQWAEKGLRVSLIRRFFFARLKFINIAKKFFEVSDFYDLIGRIVYPPEGRGRLGGKSAGLFLADRILKKELKNSSLIKNLKIPKTWYVTSETVLNFMRYNNLEDVVEQKYKDIDLVRMEYPQIIQMFKNSNFPPEIVKGLSLALEDFGDKPLIVRSSSLLEDSLGTAFSGKYKSLFIANQGSREERLDALMDAIAEVYASTFSPDPIQYRAERGLLDFHEEMGILIQEVVGTKMGDYFLPSFAGVAFSNNEFRWSPRIQREDGLIRLVPGLGTRAVDRVSDDYPILIAPGQPKLRVNITPDEILRYSPRKIDVINMKTNRFETLDVNDLTKIAGDDYPGIQKLISVYENNLIKKPSPLIDFEKDDVIFTFEALVRNTSFVKQMHVILKTLQKEMGTPVDIEFAADGKDFYLLQCRPQSFSVDSVASPIPKDIPDDRILFSANRYVSNGHVPDITHVIYVDPHHYSLLQNLDDLNAVGRAVGQANKILPKRQFILMGPGRWGSRGDIKLGVKVTYSDFNNCAMLVEIARKKGNYLPELSFGTHFFQDLVESSIRYLPLYPDDDTVHFNDRFLTQAHNILPEILPDYASLSDTLRIIDIPRSMEKRILKIVMNADLDEALAYFTIPDDGKTPDTQSENGQPAIVGDHWRWRQAMAEKIASVINSNKFGVKAMYLIGSAKNATAGPGSDIDLLIHFTGTERQRNLLRNWLGGWSQCLAEMNYLRTGYKSDGLLDIHLITNEDIKKKTSYAVKIGAITDAARPLPM